MQTGNSQGLKVLLANTYTLYLKTQNYHWNVKGQNFIMLHEFFEQQYRALAEAIDTIAERLRALENKAPGSLQEFLDLKTLSEAKAEEEIDAPEMLADLVKDHAEMKRGIVMLLEQARSEGDEVTEDLLIERLEYHEKILWMLKSHL